jgi:hypothetical protein
MLSAPEKNGFSGMSRSLGTDSRGSVMQWLKKINLQPLNIRSGRWSQISDFFRTVDRETEILGVSDKKPAEK